MHDFKKFPELRNNQMEIYYFDSPHKQITEDFKARVIKVTDGDTVRVSVNFRDFDFPIRLKGIAAPELKEGGGEASQRWLSQFILNKDVEVLINPEERVEKWGRLLGEIIFQGMSANNLSVMSGFSVNWEDRKDGKLPDFNKELENANKF